MLGSQDTVLGGGRYDGLISVLGGDGGIQLADNFLFYENGDGVFTLESTNFMNSIDLNSNVVPEMVDIDLDGDLDLFIGQDYNTSTFPIRGRIFFFRNIGDETFQLEDSEFLGTDIGNSLYPVFADIDSDNDLDLFIGNYNGTVMFYENIGTASSFDFMYVSDLESVDVGSYSAPVFEDIDSDGDLDLFIGENYGKIFFYENTGNQFDFNYSLMSNNFSNIDVGYRSAPTFADLNLDSKKEMFVGSNNQGIQVYNKRPSNIVPEFSLNECVNMPYLGLNTKPDLYYLESDLLMLTGLSTGGLFHLRYEMDLLGDINQDSIINIQDIIIIINYIIMMDVDIDYCLADINYDNYVDLLDIIQMVGLLSD